MFDRKDQLTFTEGLRLQFLDARAYALTMSHTGGDQEESESDKAQFRVAQQQQLAADLAASMNHSMTQIRG